MSCNIIIIIIILTPLISLLNILTSIFICISMGHYLRFLRDILKLNTSRVFHLFPTSFPKINILTGSGEN